MHKIVVGLGFGDECKGATVDWLCATTDVKAVIRYNGGPQAAHNVVQPDGRHHTFAQFGSGTFHGVPTHFSHHAMFNPFNLWPERQHLMDECGLPDPLDMYTVAQGAMLITPYHRAANQRVEDARGDKRHGSTGQGVGETRYYHRAYPHLTPRVSDMHAPYALRRLLTALRDHYVAKGFDMSGIMSPDELTQQYVEMGKLINIVPDAYVNMLLDSGDCVFEGAQGVLLDELYGFNPHTTFSKTTQQNARTILDGRDAEVYGLTRAYHTRHGAGPFPSEDLGIQLEDVPEPHNGTGVYQGSWRVGALDLSLLKYAVHVNGGVDKIVVSHMDYFNDKKLPPLVAGYNVWRNSTTLDSWLDRDELIGAPYTMEQSIQLGKELSQVVAGLHVPLLMDDSVRENIDYAIERATGMRPYAYSYGSTWEDRVLADVPAVV